MEEACFFIQLQDNEEKKEVSSIEQFEKALPIAISKVSKRLYIIGCFAEHFNCVTVSKLNSLLTFWYSHIERILNQTICLVDVDILLSGPGFPVIKKDDLTNLNQKPKLSARIADTGHTKGDLKKFDVGVLGGTFDRLHSGHKVMLTLAAMVSRKSLHIGISGEALLKKKKHGEYLQDFKMRKDRVLGFVSSVNPSLTVFVAELQDMYGPSLFKECEVLVVSEETKKGGELVNIERTRLGRKPCTVVTVDLVAAQKSGEKTSSTLLREFAKVKSWLEVQWDGVCRSLNVKEEVSKAWFTRLVRAYCEPQRHYHTLTHIWYMLRLLVLHSDICKQTSVIHIATWFHDCVYEPKEKDNELRSVLVFKEFANEASSSTLYEISDLIEQYIKATIKHRIGDSNDSDLALFLDLDLSILGSPSPQYTRYSKQIRSEYIHVPLEDYRKKRAIVMKSFLERKVLYFTKQFQKDLEGKARSNLSKEIDSLEHPLQL